MFARHCIVGAIFALSVSAPLFAQTTDVEFFESQDPARAGAAVLLLPQLEDGGAEGRPGSRHQRRAAQGRRVRPGVGAGKPG